MANMTFKANLLPNSDLEYNLGSSDKRWIINGWNLIPLQYWTGDSDNPIFIKLNQTIKNSGNFYFFGIIKLLYSNTLRKPSIITFLARLVGDTGGFDRAIFYDSLLAINGLTIFRDENNYIYLKLTPNGKYLNFLFSVAEASNNLKLQQLAIEVLTVSPNIYQETIFERAMIPNATTAIAGLMSAADKEKLDGIAEGAISGVTSVRVLATSPIISSSSAASSTTLNTTISLDDDYGDTKNPYGIKNRNLVLASSTNTDGVSPSFRALVAADLPTMYWANVAISNTSATNKSPTFGTVTINNGANISSTLSVKSGYFYLYPFSSSYNTNGGTAARALIYYNYDNSNRINNTIYSNANLSVPGIYTTGNSNSEIKGQLTINTMIVNGNSSFNNLVNFNNQIPTALTAENGDNSTKLATTAFVTNAVTSLSGPMRFIGTLGTGGTVTSIDAAAASNKGYAYKVITTATYLGISAKEGDLLVSNGQSWILIPSGDEPSGTVTNIKLEAGSGISINSEAAITTFGTRTISHADTSSATNMNTGGRTYINKISFDDFGHVVSYATGTESETISSSWATATTTGPTLSVTVNNANTTAPIPIASDSQSGVITTGNLTIAGNKTFKKNIRLNNAGYIGGLVDGNNCYLCLGTTDGTTDTRYIVLNSSALRPNSSVAAKIDLGSSGLPWQNFYTLNNYIYNFNKTLVGRFGSAVLGTTTTDGETRFVLGNSTGSGSDNNSYGTFYLYGTGTRYAKITYDGLTYHTNWHIPSYGTSANEDIYFAHTGGTSAVGSNTQPVYVAENGRLTQGTQYAGGTNVTLNGTPKSGNTIEIYTPTTAGNSGLILISSGNGAPQWSNTTSLSDYKYWANIESTSAATYNTEPEVKSIKITNNTSANTAATNGVVLQYDATLKVLNFVFA